MNDQFNAVVNSRIEDAYFAWLTTVKADGTPQTTPVWFIRDGDTFLVYSMPNTHKVRNIAHNPIVSLAYAADKHGEEFFVITGTASIDPSAPRVIDNAPYIEKYDQDIIKFNGTHQGMSETYTVAIRITPVRVRAQ